LKAFPSSTLEGTLARLRITEIAVGQEMEQAIEAMNRPAASNLDELHFFFFAGLEADGRPGRNVEAQAISGGAIKRESAIGFEEVVMTANLDGAVARVAHQDAPRLSTLVRNDRALRLVEQILAGIHGPSISANRIVDGDELGAIGESGLHLNFMNHFWNAVHDLSTIQNSRPEAHNFGDGFSIAGCFEDFGGKDGDGLNIVEF
jgi:hypothetical protein